MRKTGVRLQFPLGKLWQDTIIFVRKQRPNDISEPGLKYLRVGVPLARDHFSLSSMTFDGLPKFVDRVSEAKRRESILAVLETAGGQK